MNELITSKHTYIHACMYTYRHTCIHTYLLMYTTFDGPVSLSSLVVFGGFEACGDAGTWCFRYYCIISTEKLTIQHHDTPCESPTCSCTSVWHRRRRQLEQSRPRHPGPRPPVCMHVLCMHVTASMNILYMNKQKITYC